MHSSHAPLPRRRAVIDVGTNSVKLLVAELSGEHVRRLLETSEQTRLGAGFFESHQLQPEPISRTAQAVARFASEAAVWNPEHIRVIATSAARDALNPADLIQAIHATSRLPLEIISGDQEANWAFRGVATDPGLSAKQLLILDLGGGSTELILGHKSATCFSGSFPIGTVRLLERFPPSDPPQITQWKECQDWIDAFIETNISPRLLPALGQSSSRSISLVGTGGTSTILARMKFSLDTFDASQIDGACLSRTEILAIEKGLWESPLAQRQTWPGLPPNRADVILMGAALFARFMEKLNFPELRVSTRGMRFAALMDS